MNKTQSSVTGYQGPVHVREVYTPDRYEIEIVESNTFKPGSENHKKFLYHPVTISPGNTEALGMLRSTCRAAAVSCNFPGTYSVIGR
ncbi:hypothetical protein, partial [Pseudomonas putida]